MSSLNHFPDFLWKLLLINSVCSFTIFATFLAVHPLLKKISGKVFHRVSQISVIGILSAIVFGSLLLLIADRDLQEKCFGSFVHDRGSSEITRIIAMMWVIVALGLLLKDVIQYRKFKKMILNNRVQKRSDYLLVTDQLSASTVGIFKPQVIIPLGLLEDSKTLRHVLCHEQEHSKNWDGLWSLAGLLILRFCWINPLAIFFEHLRVLAMEMATDESVIQSQNLDPFEYTQSLLNVLNISCNKTKSRFAPGATTDYKMLKARLENLLLKQNTSKKRWYKFWTATAILLAWPIGFSHAFASLNLHVSNTTEDRMCYQVQHEKLIESWLHVEPPKNKCE